MTQTNLNLSQALLSGSDDPTFRSRTIHLYDVVDSVSVKQIIEEIEQINLQDEEEELKFKNKYGSIPDRKPIVLDISTYGGVVYDGLVLISTIEQSKTPIITRVNGYAMSMGLLIFLAGHERHISRHGSLMYHQISGGVVGKLKDQEEDLEISKELQIQLEDYVLERTKITKKKLKEIYNTKQDYYLNAKESLELGLATRII